MNNEQIDLPIPAGISARELVSIAHALIDAQDIDDNPDDDQLLVRAGIKTGIATMCIAVTDTLHAMVTPAAAKREAIPHTSASLANEAAAVAILQKLDGYMAASGYDADHPWRREIASASETGPYLADRKDLQRLRERMRADLATPAPMVPINEVVDVLSHLQAIGNGHDAKSSVSQACALARSVIEGLLPHAGPGMQA